VVVVAAAAAEDTEAVAVVRNAPVYALLESL
jgi:hypothetical protein